VCCLFTVSLYPQEYFENIVQSKLAVPMINFFHLKHPNCRCTATTDRDVVVLCIVRLVFFKRTKLENIIHNIILLPVSYIFQSYCDRNYNVRFYRCRAQLNSNPFSNLSAAPPLPTSFDSGFRPTA